MAMSSRRVPGIRQLPVHGSTMHDDGENAMEKQWTEQDLHSFVQAAQVVFDGVSLTEEQPEPGWQDESLQVDYELRGGRVDCVLRRIVKADGKRWKLQMSAPLAGNVLPEERMTPRERELCRDDMSHDFLTGVYNRQYLERVFGAKLEQWARQGRSAAVALVALDKGPQLCDTYGQPVMDQLHCFVGNQWKKHYDTPMHQVVCRLTGSIFVVGSVDTTGPQLAARMQELYEQMPHECITTTGMMHRVQFTMSGAAAGLDEVEAKNWPALYELCDARLRNLYHQLNQEAHTAMEACGGTAQGQSAMAKFNTKMGISMKTLTDKSTRNLAEMLTQGSGMGVVDCVKAQKDYPNAAPGTKRLAQRLMEFEEDNRVRLEQFL